MPNRRRTPRWLVALCAALALSVPGAGLQRANADHESVRVTAQHRVDFSQQQLDRMLAPIALYPDSLLSQILMASTYPLEVVEAARWSRANPHLQGRAAVEAVDHMRWDPSVKSLVAFPRILALMSERLEWTRDLGDAFLAQEPHVMETIQDLRRRAYAAGNLRSGREVRVDHRDRLIFIEPVDVELAYVPYYDPAVVYGSWWWPAYPPVRWAPWPGYLARPGYASAFYWGPPVAVGSVFFFGAFDWHRRHATIVRRHEHVPFVERSTTVQHANRRPVAVGSRWTHDPAHRRGVEYRSERVRQTIAREQGIAQVERRSRTAGSDIGVVPAPNASPPVARVRSTLDERSARGGLDSESNGDAQRFRRRNAMPDVERAQAVRQSLPPDSVDIDARRAQRMQEMRSRKAERAQSASQRADAEARSQTNHRGRVREDHPGRGVQMRERSADTRPDFRMRDQPAVTAGAIPSIEHRRPLHSNRAAGAREADQSRARAAAAERSARIETRSHGRENGRNAGRAERRERGNS